MFFIKMAEALWLMMEMGTKVWIFKHCAFSYILLACVYQALASECIGYMACVDEHMQLCCLLLQGTGHSNNNAISAITVVFL